ncbi:UMF1 family MFS transporter [Methylopila capsulata]|uniref:MFS transporter n=1 Tax=Methylopila capsulata TaxID=61654 RepID=A0A9W6IQW5_9HYPH|nr:MFS transporter [Methylopila capsulata]MBM7851780.1 UMF1 family MFS transporter [Methylopila capsulata]GLK54843.1 MFS transporter [Methylopila capsulata]
MPQHRTVSRRAVAAWALYDAATQPVFTLLATFVFAPFFVSRLMDDPAEGQALWGVAAGTAGLIVGLATPPLGAIADRTGGRKLWIAGFSLLIVLGASALWFAVPGSAYAVPIALGGFVVATVGAECATAFTNAMMPTLAPPERIGRLSGLGWATGYVGGLIALAIALLLFSADPEDGLTLAGIAPILGLDPATSEGDRAAGPFSALWYLVFAAPLFLFTPDVTAGSPRGAVTAGLRDLWRTLKSLRRSPDLALFLAAHMLYVDGLTALFAFGGIYGAGALGWGPIETGVFGVLVIVSGIVGSLVGGWLDDRVGPERVVAWSLGLLTAAAVAIASIDRARILFVVPVTPPVPDDALFSSAPERLFIGLALVLGAASGPLQASSRSLLVRLAPKEKLTQAFGLFALSGKVTSFLGPFAVAAVTALTDSQRVGVSVLIAFFLGGAALLGAVRVPDARD